jgi:CubicO group peptidase (beta-lactamase class C family)
VRLPVSYEYWPGIDEPFEQPWFEYNAGDGSIVSTGGDLANYVRMILNRGALPNGRLVSERAFNMMTTAFKENYGYGPLVGCVLSARMINSSASQRLDDRQ